MNYRSIKDLNDTIIKNLHIFPREVDLIVGIPRSGLFVANLLALYLNKPLTDIKGLKEKRIINSGARYQKNEKNKINNFDEIKKIAVIDDSLATGRSLKEAKEIIITLNISIDILYGVAYIAPGMEKEVDFYFEVCEKPRVFEWNIMHHDILSESCIDIDGVLCRDPSSKENDDGKRYIKFIRNCEPLFIPTVKLGYLVTSRLEKYRKDTEFWLKKHGLEYEKLIMMNLPDKETRVKAGNHAQFKSEIYKKSEKKLFVESSLKQSIEIANLTGKQVYCIENREMVLPKNSFVKTKLSVKRKIETYKPRIKKKLRKTFFYPMYKFFKKIK
jgi:uncharacterized HAD superfamily protein/hypoxanthine phosphoribosyltransferase